jgi:phage gpG-like protein
VKFFKESFVKGGFTDSSFQKWSQANTPMAGKKTMYSSGNLMRSIKKLSATLDKVVVIADSPYAAIHNEGGYIVVTARMKKYFWAKFYEFEGGKSYLVKSQKQSNNKANRSLNSKAEFCKAMALKPVGEKIKIPKHQFMGNSKALMGNFDKWFGKVIKNQVEDQFNKRTININLGTV